MCTYSVWGDESSDEKKERIFTVAGLFGDEGQWEDTKKKWCDLTKGREFHATEFEKRFPDLYKDLIGLLVESGLMGWACAMSLEDYSVIFDNPTPHLPYYVCFTKVIQMFARRTRFLIPQGTVEFTFDRNLQTQYNATFMYDYMANLPEWEDRDFISDEISFSSRKNPKIQAADLWAHEVKNFGEQCVLSNQPIKSLHFEKLEKTRRFALNFHSADGV